MMMGRNHHHHHHHNHHQEQQQHQEQQHHHQHHHHLNQPPSSSCDGAEKKYERFEKWLYENQGEFSMLELRSYDDNVNNVTVKPREASSSSHDNVTEEKKEMTGMSMNINTSTTSTSGSSKNSNSKNSNQKHGTGGGRSDIDIDTDTDMDGQPTQESEMRGVHAKVDIPPNTICVSIPKKCLITVEMGQATPIGQIILKSDLDLDAPKHIFLMIFLLYDRKIHGEQSFFKPYYDILPKTLHNIPIFWSWDELSYLEGSYLLAQIADRNEAITEDYYAICEVAPELASIATLEEFKWARMCVCSRNFGLQIDGHRTSALVPHADMLNHHRPRETKWTYDDELEAFTITTLQRIPTGAQVYDSYGQKCNHRFLLNYGFAVEDNRELDGFCPNEVPIELKVLQNDPLYDAKLEFWKRGDSDGNGSITEHHSTNISAAVAAAVDAARSQQIDPAVAMHSAMRAAVSAAASDLQNAKRSNQTANTTTTSSSSSSSSATRSQSQSSYDSTKRVRACVSNNENTRVLFSMLRVLACNEEELSAISSSPTLPFGDNGRSSFLNKALRGFTSTHPDTSSQTMQHVAFFRTARDIRHPLNLRNEKAAMHHLLKVIKAHLSKYPCSLAQDISDLMDEELYPRFSNRRHAKIQVRGEKEVLHHYALWAQTAIEVIEIVEREIMMETNNRIAPQKGFDYITRAMEDDDGVGPNTLHHTIIRYCCDVLGALRKEALNNVRRENDMKIQGIRTS